MDRGEERMSPLDFLRQPQRDEHFKRDRLWKGRGGGGTEQRMQVTIIVSNYDYKVIVRARG